MEQCFYMIINYPIEMKLAILHDLHKMKGAKHKNNKKLSTSADADASKMSRPRIIKKPKYAKKVSNYRISLLDDTLCYNVGQNSRDELCSKIREKYNLNNLAIDMYNSLLNIESKPDISNFNESPLYNNEFDLPYTSLKYHTILTTNLHWNYLHKMKFKDFQLKIISSDVIGEIFDVIFKDTINSKCLVISDKNSYPQYEAHSIIGSTPFMNYGDVLSRMKGNIYFDKSLYANLRRIKSWSIGLQYLEDYSKSHGSL